MQYMLLIYGDERSWDDATPEQKAVHYRRHRTFGEMVIELGGKIVSAAPLESTSTATSLRGDLITDGPFVETRETLGGFYIIEASDLDQVIGISRHCPVFSGGIEIRPLVDMSTA